MKKVSGFLAMAAFLSLAAPVAAQDKAVVALYNDKCAVCHGEDGAGKTTKGKKLKVQDVREAIKKMSEADMNKVITNGKDPDMDAFGKELKPDQIQALVLYLPEPRRQEMIGADSFVIAFVIVTVALAALVALRTEVTRARGGKILAFVGLFMLPVISLAAGFSRHMERATTTQFCLSCHVMEDYGKSLLVDDPGYIAAAHYQNNRVPRDQACYTCHTNYAMFGGLRAKMHGARHVYVQYFGKVPAPADIKLYDPFNNRECLHCHAGARKFEAQAAHTRTPDSLNRIMTGQLSCTSSRCHDTIHDVGTLSDPDLKFWKTSLR